MGVYKYNIESMRTLAEKWGGKCLSDTYSSYLAKMKWECKKGHQWEAAARTVISGGWCLRCHYEDHPRLRRYTIEEIRKIIEDRGGKCLSDQLKDHKSKIKVMCKKGHQWEPTAESLKHGQWCPYCVGKGRTIKDMQEYAKANCGVCLSEEYVNCDTKLLWKCEKGHTWEARPRDVINEGSWCPECADHLPYTIGEMKVYAQQLGGDCLSDIYINNHTPLLWKCKFGHTWQARPHNVIVSGTWCPECAQKLPITIKQMKAIALSHEGKCLSDAIKKGSVYLTWECKKGHQWEASYYSIQHGYWCPTCGHEKVSAGRRHSIDFVRDKIEAKKGEWIAGEYLNNNSPLTVKCVFGHTWITNLGHIISGRWCPTCAGNKRGTIEKMKEYAKTKEGECISNEYKNANTKLKWKCKFGHTWEAKPTGVVNSGTWCPYCSKIRRKSQKRFTLDDMNAIAKEHGGKCLSHSMVNGNSKLDWQCKAGHTWDAVASSIKAGHWCPKCEGCKKLTLEDMQRLAQERNGKCLSIEYVNNKSKLKWECEKGHTWEARADLTKQGRWCPYCSKRKKGTIEEMRQLATANGGKCLSDTYIGTLKKLEWQCDKRHKFKMCPSDVKSGHWCPKCRHRLGAEKHRLKIADLQQFASLHQGYCMSSQFEGYFKKYKWRCRLGHDWEDSYARVKKFWCPVCRSEGEFHHDNIK